jgi:hypothetical protein
MERTQGADGSPFSPSSVSVLCQHHELPDGTMCQMSHDVEASKLLKMLQT